jgi:hypothetical protein
MAVVLACAAGVVAADPRAVVLVVEVAGKTGAAVGVAVALVVAALAGASEIADVAADVVEARIAPAAIFVPAAAAPLIGAAVEPPVAIESVVVAVVVGTVMMQALVARSALIARFLRRDGASSERYRCAESQDRSQRRPPSGSARERSRQSIEPGTVHQAVLFV